MALWNTQDANKFVAIYILFWLEAASANLHCGILFVLVYIYFMTLIYRTRSLFPIHTCTNNSFRNDIKLAQTTTQDGRRLLTFLDQNSPPPNYNYNIGPTTSDLTCHGFICTTYIFLYSIIRNIKFLFVQILQISDLMQFWVPIYLDWELHFLVTSLIILIPMKLFG